MKIFITGADGFIGSRLVERLVVLGHDVTAMAQYNSFGSGGWLDRCNEQVTGKYRLVLGDVRDESFMAGALDGHEVVLHLAALIGIPYSYVAPRSYVDTNVVGTLNVLQAALRYPNLKVIHTSTSEVYGSAQCIPITERHPLVGQSPYSASKIAADALVTSYFRSFDLPVVTVRPFNTFGPRQSLRAVIPTIVCQLLQGVSELNLGNVNSTRDFTFVDDTVDGFISVLDGDKGFGEVFNLGTGFEVSIKHIANTIAQIMGVNVGIRADVDRFRPDKSEVDRLVSDYSKCKSVFDWMPKYVGDEGLEQALSMTIEWFSNPANLDQYRNPGYTI